MALFQLIALLTLNGRNTVNYVDDIIDTSFEYGVKYSSLKITVYWTHETLLQYHWHLYYYIEVPTCERCVPNFALTHLLSYYRIKQLHIPVIIQRENKNL